MLVLVLIGAAAISYGPSLLSGDDLLGYGDQTNYLRGSLASSSFAVTTSAVRILPDKDSRVYAVCSNMGAKSAFLSFAGNASLSWGILLEASSSYEIDADNLYTGPVYAITTGGTTRISCVEK